LAVLYDEIEEDGEDEDYDPAGEGEEDEDGEDEGEEYEDDYEDDEGAGGEGEAGGAGQRGSPRASNPAPYEPAMLIEEVMALHQDARLDLEDVLAQHAPPATPAPVDAPTGKGKAAAPPPAATRGAALEDDSD
jgi:hypothetical protein